MGPQDKLFALIQSLTPAEKSYFTKYSRLNAAKEKPDYLLLFEFLDNAKTYDEVAIKKRFKHEKFISHLPRKKTQLKDKIMESLSHYHASHTVEASLRLQMNLLPTLYEKAVQNKALIKEFENQIKAIKKKATEAECFGILIDIFKWEKQLLELWDTNKKDKDTLALLEVRRKFQDDFNKDLDLEEASLRTHLIILRDPKIKKNENRQIFQDSVVNILEKYDPEDLPKMAKRNYYFAKCNYYFFAKNWELAHDVAKNLIDTYSEDDTQNVIISKKYKQHLCNYLVASEYASKLDDYLNIINILKRMSSLEDILLFNTIHFKMLIYYLDQRQFEEAIRVSEDVYNRWDDLCAAVQKRRQLAYCYNIMVAYWFGNKMEDAIYWLSKILNFEVVRQGQRFVNAARIIQLPIYYDYQDDNLENRIGSTRKVLAKKGELNEYRQIILSGFRKLVRCIDRREKRDCISDMQFALVQAKNEHNIKAMDLECLLLWSKLKVGEQTLERINK